MLKKKKQENKTNRGSSPLKSFSFYDESKIFLIEYRIGSLKATRKIYKRTPEDVELTVYSLTRNEQYRTNVHQFAYSVKPNSDETLKGSNYKISCISKQTLNERASHITDLANSPKNKTAKEVSDIVSFTIATCTDISFVVFTSNNKLWTITLEINRQGQSRVFGYLMRIPTETT